MSVAFKTYILPILEYCSPIWNPHLLQDIDRLENVQRSFTKKLLGLKDKSYRDRLTECRLVSLELRCLRIDLIICFKIVRSLVALKFDDFFVFDSNTRTRGHHFKLRVPRCQVACRSNFFHVRIVPVWNALPVNIVNSATLDDFKRDIKIIIFQNFYLEIMIILFLRELIVL